MGTNEPSGVPNKIIGGNPVVSLLRRHSFGEECVTSQKNVCVGGFPVVESIPSGRGGGGRAE